MRKQIMTAALAGLLLLTGCSGKQRQMPEVSLPDNAAEATVPYETEAETVPPRPVAERAAALQAAGETHVFDEPGVLTDEERAQYDAYLEWLAGIRQIRTAAVITDALGGESPEAFAQDYYRTLFGEGTSGFLVLINNDTQRDLVYTEGVCRTYLADTSLQIAQATPLLVEGKYADALEILLPVGELVPDRVLDRADALTAEQTLTLCERANALEERRTVLLTALPAAEPVTETAEETDTDVPEETVTETAAAETSEPDASETGTENDPGTSETAAPETEVPSETEVPLLPASEELQALADAVKTRNEADVLLVIDVTSGTCVLSGEEDGVRDGIQLTLQTDGVFAAVDYYYKLGE